jgi:hypothetical protein
MYMNIFIHIYIYIHIHIHVRIPSLTCGNDDDLYSNRNTTYVL